MENKQTSQQKFRKNNNNEEVYDYFGKENLIRRCWIKIFRISEEENQDSDQANDMNGNSCIDENIERITTQQINDQNWLREKKTYLQTVT